jgi:hypothetical protein
METHCHRQQTWLVVFQNKVLICKLLDAVDGSRTRTISVYKVSALDHEAFDLVIRVSTPIIKDMRECMLTTR